MDACVCLYHDHHGLSCVKILHAMTLLQRYHKNVWLMTTTYPVQNPPHKSKVKKYYCSNGFPIIRLTKTLGENIEEILKVHLSIHKTL